MAFFNRIGSLLKQTVSKNVTSELSAPTPLFQVIRSMSSSSKLFVGGLSYNTDEMSLKEAFAPYGELIDAKIITDRDTGRSRGFAFITYTSTEAATSAIQAFDGQDLHGRTLRVNYATEKPRGGSFGGGYSGGGGGYGGGYGGGGGGYGGYGGGYGGNRGGYQGGDYGGSGGGNYGGGNYGGGNYGGGGGNYSGGGNNYPSGGGDANNFASGGGGGYGGGNSIQSDGNYGGSVNLFSGDQSSVSLPTDETIETFGENKESVDVALNEDIGKDALEGKHRDENDEKNDLANNTRG